jgi:hypothetical protein
MQKNNLPLSPQRMTIGFGFSFVGRALQESLANRQFGKAEMMKIIEYLMSDPPQCVYCGSIEIKRWDHLIAVKNGGETVIGNMVPACSKCDDSKRDIAFDIWMQSDFPSSPKSRGIQDIQERINRIYKYMNHFNYQVKPLDTRLTPDELIELERIKESIQRIRKECEDLVASFAKRNNRKY